jgi:hypothetical protein
MKRLILSLSAFAAFTSPAIADDADLLAEVKRYEGTVYFTDPASLGSDRYVVDALDNLDLCIAAVDTAKAGGHGDETEVGVHDSSLYGDQGRMQKEPGRTAEHFASLSAVRAACAAMRTRVGVVQVTRAVDEAVDMEQQLRTRELTKSAAVVAEMQAGKCVESVDTAISRRISPDATVPTKLGELRLDEVKDKGCGAITALAAEANNAGQAAVDAKFAPWKKGLSGDKLDTFLNKNMIHFRVRGRGGKELVTPADFARSNVWFEGLNSDSPRRWAIKRFKFSGDRLVGTDVITGAGKVVPSSAYK